MPKWTIFYMSGHIEEVEGDTLQEAFAKRFHQSRDVMKTAPYVKDAKEWCIQHGGHRVIDTGTCWYCGAE